MDTKLVMFANMKGGVGKTTLTNWAGVFFQQNTDLSTLVIDGDVDQLNLMAARQKNEEEYTGDVDWDEVSMYTLLPLDAANFNEKYSSVINGQFDIVLYDVPGHVNNEEILKVYMQADIIILPSSHTDNDLQSTSKIIDFINTQVVPLRKKAGLETKVYWMFHKISSNLKKVTQIIENEEEDPYFENVPLMKTSIPYLPSKASDLNTVDFGEDGAFYNKYIKSWAGEILDIIKD